MNFGGRRGYLQKMESTAMSDIVFILLIFFLLSSNFMVQAGIDIELPKVVDAMPIETQEVVVTISPEGDLFVNEKEVTWQELDASLGDALASAARKIVVVRADERSEFGRAVEVMEAARKLGAGLAVATEPRETR